MGNIFTTTPNNFNELSEEKREEKSRLEPDNDILMFISQFAKVYYVEKQIKRLAFATPLILN